MERLILYTYFRSSAAYRVRIALNLKGLTHELRPVHLLRDGGENFRPEYLALNPQGLVPALIHGDRVLTQSLAIIEYLEESLPGPTLLPRDPAGRAQVRALAQLIACDIHPLNNLRVGDYFKQRLGQDHNAWLTWYCHWIAEGFAAFAKLIEDGPAGEFCHGDAPTLADVCLVPQVYNARRFDCDLAAYPAIQRIDSRCRALEAFARAAPENQPDQDY